MQKVARLEAKVARLEREIKRLKAGKTVTKKKKKKRKIGRVSRSREVGCHGEVIHGSCYGGYSGGGCRRAGRC